MSSPLYYADFHCHPSMKPFHSLTAGNREDMWKKCEAKGSCGSLLLDHFIESMTKYSQTNLDQCSNNRVFLLFSSLYPVELPWFDMNRLGKLFIGRNRRLKIAECLTAFSHETIEELFFKCVEGKPISFNYFERLIQEFQFIISESLNADNPFTILTDYNDFNLWKLQLISSRSADNQKKSIAVIFCIEGAHSLLGFECYEQLKEFVPQIVCNEKWDKRQTFYKMLESNINSLKKMGIEGSHAPFYITFAHHFWNMLAGHASSIDNPLLNQTIGRDSDISDLGRFAIELLLRRDKDGRRILIDMKHMSKIARQSYYTIVQQMHIENDKVPIIASHAAVTGIRKNGNTEHSFFNSADINLFDEDILEICNTKGMIGIMMEEGRLVNKEVMKYVKKMLGALSDKARFFYATAVLANILHIVDIAGNDAWDCICLGSDFDGMINSLDTFDSVAKYPVLFETLHNLLESGTPILFPLDINDDVYAGSSDSVLFSTEKIKLLMYGQTSAMILEKLAYKNIEHFLEQYFTDDYLKAKIIIA